MRMYAPYCPPADLPVGPPYLTRRTPVCVLLTPGTEPDEPTGTDKPRVSLGEGVVDFLTRGVLIGRSTAPTPPM